MSLADSHNCKLCTLPGACCAASASKTPLKSPLPTFDPLIAALSTDLYAVGVREATRACLIHKGANNAPHVVLLLLLFREHVHTVTCKGGRGQL